MSGDEETWAATGMSGDLVRVGVEATGDAPDGATQDPPAATEQATPTAAPVTGIGLGTLVRAQ